MIAETDIAYIAGLFDGEGSVHFKRGIEKKKKHKGEGYRLSNSMRISMEITMTDHSVLIWLHEVLGVGTLRPKTVKGRRKDGTKSLFSPAHYPPQSPAYPPPSRSQPHPREGGRCQGTP